MVRANKLSADAYKYVNIYLLKHVNYLKQIGMFIFLAFVVASILLKTLYTGISMEILSEHYVKSIYGNITGYIIKINYSLGVQILKIHAAPSSPPKKRFNICILKTAKSSCHGTLLNSNNTLGCCK